MTFLQLSGHQVYGIPTDHFSPDWILPVVLVPVVIYIAAAVFEKYPLLRITRTVFRYSYAESSFRQGGSAPSPYSRLMGIMALLNISTFFYFSELFNSFFIFGLRGFTLWLTDLLICAAAILIRYIILALLSTVTRTKESFNEYFYYLTRFYMFLSLPLLAINFFIPYLEAVPDNILITIGLVFSAAVLVLRFTRLMVIFLRRSFSLFYMILYLCALEIIPVLIFLKYLSGTVS